MARLTLSEMAAHLQVSSKTFAKDARERGIPYIAVGKRRRYDPAAVEAFLAAVDAAPVSNVYRFKPAKKRKASAIKSKFAEAVGL